MNSRTYFNEIIRNIKHHGSVADFRIKGKTLYRQYRDAVQLINFQGSQSNTADVLKFTVNLGIYLQPLAILDEDPETTTNILKAHWSRRIGSYKDDGIDYWWTVQSESQVQSVSYEVIQILEQSAIPAMNGLSSTAALCAIWKRGDHPGIYERQRQRFLELLCGE